MQSKGIKEISSSLDGRLSALPPFIFDESWQKVDCLKVSAMPSFDANAMTSLNLFKQNFELPTFRRSSTVSQIEGRQCRK